MNPPLTKSQAYRTRRDVATDVVAFLWDGKPFSQRQMVLPEPGTYSVAVTADVNGHLVSFEFDNYGRVIQAQVV